MNKNTVLRVLEKSPNLQSLAGLERRMWTSSALRTENYSYSKNLLRPPTKRLVWKPSQKWRTFRCTQCGVAKTTPGRETKEEKKGQKWFCCAKQCQIEHYRWLALWTGAPACFQAHFSVIFFPLSPWACSLWRVRMRHGASFKGEGQAVWTCRQKGGEMGFRKGYC